MSPGAHSEYCASKYPPWNSGARFQNSPASSRNMSAARSNNPADRSASSARSSTLCVWPRRTACTSLGPISAEWLRGNTPLETRTSAADEVVVHRLALPRDANLIGQESLRIDHLGSQVLGRTPASAGCEFLHREPTNQHEARERTPDRVSLPEGPVASDLRRIVAKRRPRRRHGFGTETVILRNFSPPVWSP